MNTIVAAVFVAVENIFFMHYHSERVRFVIHLLMRPDRCNMTEADFWSNFRPRDVVM